VDAIKMQINSLRIIVGSFRHKAEVSGNILA
jgi:hypothetical protein